MKQFDALVQDILRERWSSSPVTATMDGMHESDHLLDEFSPNVLANIAAQRQRFITELETIADENLDVSRRIDKRVLLGQLNASVYELMVTKHWQKDPSIYLQTGLYGIYILLVRSFAPAGKRADAAMQRAEALPRLLHEAKTNIKACPRIFATTARETAEGAKSFFQSLFLSECRKVDSSRAQVATESCVQALDEFIAHIDGVWLPTATEEFAIGRDAFAAKLKHEHGLAYTPEQLLEIGENARRDAVAKLEALAAQIDSSVTWPELIARYKSEHPPREGLLDAYRREMERARGFVAQRELVSLPPEEHLAVVETPPFARPTTPFAALMPPAPFERDQRSFFYVTPVDAGPHEAERLREHCVYSIPVTALHEGFPGHHLQLVLANRNRSLVRKVFSTPVMVEGWALYCEEMMYELGYYPDAATRLFQLKDLLWRACRVILDVQLHTGAISPEAAVNYLVTEAYLERSHAQAEVNRYCSSPTQPMSYLIGRQEIFRLRNELETIKHGKFELKKFHDEFLSWGSIPIAYIAEGVRSSPAFSAAA